MIICQGNGSKCNKQEAIAAANNPAYVAFEGKRFNHVRLDRFSPVCESTIKGVPAALLARHLKAI